MVQLFPMLFPYEAPDRVLGSQNVQTDPVFLFFCNQVHGGKKEKRPMRFRVTIRVDTRYANDDVIGPPTRWQR